MDIIKELKKIVKTLITNLLFVGVAYFSFFVGLRLLFDTLIPINTFSSYVFVLIIIVFVLITLITAHNIQRKMMNDFKFSVFMDEQSKET